MERTESEPHTELINNLQLQTKTINYNREWRATGQGRKEHSDVVGWSNIKQGLLIHCRTQLHSLVKVYHKVSSFKSCTKYTYRVSTLTQQKHKHNLPSVALILLLMVLSQFSFQRRYTRLELCTGHALVGWNVSGALVLSRGGTCRHADHQVNNGGWHGRVSLSRRLPEESHAQLQSEFNCHK